MTGLVRPLRKRIVGGVAAAFSERYRISLWIIRVAFLAAVIASGFGLVLYLIFWISMPSESVMVGRSRLARSTEGGETRFNQLSTLLLERMEGVEKGPHGVTFLAAIILLGLGIFFQVAKIAVPPAIFTAMIPQFVIFTAERLAPALLFSSLGLMFLLPQRGRRVIEYDQTDAGLGTDESESKAIFGVLSSISNRLKLDAAYLRVTAILLSILTAGVAAIIYVGFGLFLSRKGKPTKQARIPSDPIPGLEDFNPIVRATIGVVFTVMAFIRVATEFRWFFFNEPYVSGIMLLLLGLLLTFRTLVRGTEVRVSSQLWLLLGPALMLYGVYQLTLAVFHVQLPFVARFQLAYVVAGLSLMYYSFIALTSEAGRVGIVLGIILIGCAALLEAHLLPQHFLVVVTAGYDFFYPLLFAACGLWLLLTND